MIDHIIAPCHDIQGRVRLYKLAKYLEEKGIYFSFWGWQRFNTPPSKGNLANVKKFTYLQKTNPKNKVLLKFLYIVWAIKVFFLGLRIKRNTAVWALGLETAFPLLLPSKLKGFKIYFDDADRFVLFQKLPHSLRYIAEFFERKTSHHCYVHIIPNLERYNYNSPKFFELKNSPSQAAYNSAKMISYEEIKNCNKMSIYINGWLVETRGIKTILSVAQDTLNENIVFYVAGKVGCEEGQKLIQLKNTIYFGQLPYHKALSLYQYAHFIFTFYDPSIEINRFAEANKWGDAIAMGTPIIVNSEVLTAKFLKQANVAITAPYNDSLLLKNKLLELRDDQTKYNELKKNIGQMSNHFPFFEKQLDKLFNLHYG